jgi:hypothetical protein
MPSENHCPVCYESYDAKEHIPMLFCIGQHNVCQLCVFNIKNKSSICKRSFNPKEIAPNRILLENYAKNLNSKYISTDKLNSPEDKKDILLVLHAGEI